MALVLSSGRKTTGNPGVNPCVGQPADTPAGGGITDNSNKAVTLRGRFLSSMWDLILGPVGAIRWGSTLDNTIGRVAGAMHETLGDRAHQAGRGPHAVANIIISSFGEGSDRVRNLAAVQKELKIRKEKRHTPEEQDDDEEEEEPMEISKRINPSELRKQCSEFMRYTLRKERADMQCQAFQRLVQLTTMFPGLRLMLLLSEHIRSPKLAKFEDKISMLWDRSDSSLLPAEEAEWNFWRSFAEMCLSKAPISLTIERCHITRVVHYQGTSSCVIDELLRAHGNCDAATDISSALCIRYLGQIVTLAEFWDRVKAADPARVDSPTMSPHTTVQKLCVMMRKTLQDLQPKGTRPLPFDYEGVDFLASKILEEVIHVLQTVSGIENNLVGRWYSACGIVVRLLRHEWCKEYLPHSYRLAHGEFLKARMPVEPGADVADSVPTGTQGPATVDVVDSVPTGTQGPATADVDDPVPTETRGSAAADVGPPKAPASAPDSPSQRPLRWISNIANMFITMLPARYLTRWLIESSSGEGPQSHPGVLEAVTSTERERCSKRTSLYARERLTWPSFFVQLGMGCWMQRKSLAPMHWWTSSGTVRSVAPNTRPPEGRFLKSRYHTLPQQRVRTAQTHIALSRWTRPTAFPAS
ncbi:hypothetical protein B0H10DRAFT_2061045 [Mycena sp. CBHHK59/15]|nr:hypothetical protein B0H10DRAFT_2061045 [Mycena sp. CBHHK59/15]